MSGVPSLSGGVVTPGKNRFVESESQSGRFEVRHHKSEVRATWKRLSKSERSLQIQRMVLANVRKHTVDHIAPSWLKELRLEPKTPGQGGTRKGCDRFAVLSETLQGQVRALVRLGGPR